MKYDNYYSKMIAPVALIAGTMLGCGSDNHSVPGKTTSDSDNSVTDSDNNPVPDKINLSGSVQKGPFIQGSDINIYLLDNAGNNLGSVYNTQTTDNLGNFSTTLAGLSQDYTGNLSLSGNGFFFKEVAGTLSDAQQTLKASYYADGNSAEIHMNLVTHLSFQRTMQLLKNNSDLNASVAQSQNELVASLAPTGLMYPTDATGLATDMNLFGDNNGANQYLLAVSCAFENAVDSSDSALQDLLNAYQLDLANDGLVDSMLSDKVRAGVINTDPNVCVTNLQKRAMELGIIFNVDVNGMNRALDTDLDGIVNAEDLDIDGDGVNNDMEINPYNPKIAGLSYCEGNLCWELTPTTTNMNFFQAIKYCEDLIFDNNSNWKIPTIDELKSLVKGCADFETSGTCYPKILEGPGKDGCYWDPLLEGSCGAYGSSSAVPGEEGFVWSISFHIAQIEPLPSDDSYFPVRCVRDNN